jgi:methionyl-tRNA formyltransferase
LTQPDRPAGRGLRAAASPVKSLALERHIEVYQPTTLREPAAQKRVVEAAADAMIVAAYGLLLPQPVLDAARFGAINIHASLLPRWRGAAPIQRALLAGDSETGVSIMKMDAGLDTGPVLAEKRVAIAPDEDAGSLHDKLAELGGDLLLTVLEDVAAGRAKAKPQSADGVTYAHKIGKTDTRLRWEQPAEEVERAVRAFRPAPGAVAHLAGEPLKIWRARVVDGRGEPGVVLSQGDALVVACSRDALAIEELQPAGGRRMRAADFLRGRRLPGGTRLQ